MRCAEYKHDNSTNYRVRVLLEVRAQPFVWLSSEACVLGVLAVCFLPPLVEYSVRSHLLQYLLYKVVTCDTCDCVQSAT